MGGLLMPNSVLAPWRRSREHCGTMRALRRDRAAGRGMRVRPLSGVQVFDPCGVRRLAAGRLLLSSWSSQRAMAARACA